MQVTLCNCIMRTFQRDLAVLLSSIIFIKLRTITGDYTRIFDRNKCLFSK